MKLFTTYTYLCVSLVLLMLFFLCFLAGGKQRRPMLLSAFLSAPYGFLSVLFVPAYWNPVSIAQWWGAGIEDIVFSFANGGIVWYLATWPVRNWLSLNIQIKRMLLRYLLFTASGISLGLILLFLGSDLMHGTLVVIGVAGILILWLRQELWPLCVTGACSFGLAYTGMCCAIFAIDPSFLLQWNTTALSGYHFLGVPLEEIAWSIAFGSVWPLMVAYSFDTRLSYKKKFAIKHTRHSIQKTREACKQ